ncbi:unnamed protein product [Pleuronectes platessa]|uniref:Uncharacterized protein n=1 Tax=Pleuronectes platessa TaxID=8262 RepID=A0A9N7TVB7_PLEPL|nr:unnamed protein product [Pleuronectes platessa]
MSRRPRNREAVVSLEASASSKKPWTPPDRRGEKWRRVPSKPVGFLHAASYEHQPQAGVDWPSGIPGIVPSWADRLRDPDSAVNHNTNQGGAGPHSILGSRGTGCC